MFEYAKPQQKITQRKTAQKKESPKPNLTAIPDVMKSRFEKVSGLSFDDVLMHYSSDKPTKLQAFEYTQGTHGTLDTQGTQDTQGNQISSEQEHSSSNLGLSLQTNQNNNNISNEQFIGFHINDNIAQGKETDKLTQSNRPKSVTITNNEVAQLSKVEYNWIRDGEDPEAKEIEWWRSNPYILDDKGQWRRVAREVVNNQRGERSVNHRINVKHLRVGVRKVYKAGVSKLFRVSTGSNFLAVIFKHGMVITAYYMSNDAAQRSLNYQTKPHLWEEVKLQLPFV